MFEKAVVPPEELPLEEFEEETPEKWTLNNGDVDQKLEKIAEAVIALRAAVQDANKSIENSNFATNSFVTTLRESAKANTELLLQNKDVVSETLTSLDQQIQETKQLMDLLTNSNDTLRSAMADEINSFNQANHALVVGVVMETTKLLNEQLPQVLEGFQKEIDDVSQKHQTILKGIAEVYNYAGKKEVALWVWRLLVIILLMENTQAILQIDSLWSWIKVITGLALIF